MGNMHIRLTHLDGKMPNLALMRLSAWHKQRGDTVVLSRSPERDLFEVAYDRVYGAAIFTTSRRAVGRLLAWWPDAIIGGTGSGENRTVEEIVGADAVTSDYTLYPAYQWSLGFTSRGCRQSCPFCVVPQKEGSIRSVASIADIWRGNENRNIVLLDNDFFGQTDWQARCDEIRQGGYKISWNQGINVRRITDEQARAIAGIGYYDDQFTGRRLYVAWDNVHEERVFMAGIGRLLTAGIRASHIMVYMLIGFWPNETIDDVLYRYQKIKDAGLLPYPMVYGKHRLFRAFQRWVVRRYDAIVSWTDYLAARPVA